MTKLHEDKHGFSAVEVLLVIVIAGIVGFTGWYVLHAKQHTGTLYAPTSAGSPKFKDRVKVSSSTKSVASNQTTYSFTNNYLDIKEIGVKIPIPSLVSDLTYTWTNNTATLHSQIWFKYVQSNDPTCAAQDAQISDPPPDWAGYISDVSGTKPSNYAYTVSIKGKTFAFSGHQQGCDPNDNGNPAAVNQREADDDQAIGAALEKATAD